ncbi:MAG TPA: hypothetical protein VFP34_18240, partial [Microlunatus sp.]|nr:hypothetical protein [Microlunatus sp.]
MRWPWERGPWARRAETTESPSTGSAGLSTAPAPAPAGPDHGPQEWRSLPPVQRSLADAAPSVAPPDSFRDSLVTHHNPSFLAPLGHLVDPEGPSGVVGGLASSGRPITYDSGVELRVPDHAPAKPPAPATVQRSAATLQPTGTAVSPSAPEPMTSEPVFSPSPAPEPAATEPLADEPAPAEVRSLAVDPAEIRTTTNAGRAGDQAMSSIATPGPSASNPPLVVARQVDPGGSAPLTVQRVTSGESLDHSSPDHHILDHGTSDLTPSAHTPAPSPAVDAGTRTIAAVQRSAADGPELEVTSTLGVGPDRPDAELRPADTAATTAPAGQSTPATSPLTIPVQRTSALPGSQTAGSASAPTLHLSSLPSAPT